MTRAAAVALLLATACAPGSSPAPSPTAVPSPTVSCPPAGRPDAWPAGVPRDIPRLPGLKVTEPITGGTGVGARGTAVGTTNDMVRFLVRELPAAGYALGRGSAEQQVILQPFQGPGISGMYRVEATGVLCDVTFSVVVVRKSLTPPP